MIIQILKKIKFLYVNAKHYKHNTLSKNFTTGKNATLYQCNINNHSRVAEYASLKNTSVGDYSTVGRYSKIVYTDIGKYCAISWDTTINAISHLYNHLTISAFPYVPYVGNFVKERKQKHKNLNKRSQGLDKYFRFNGAIYIGRPDRFLKEKSFFIKDNIFAYEMNRKFSIDIDGEIDFKMAEVLLND